MEQLGRLLSKAPRPDDRAPGPSHPRRLRVVPLGGLGEIGKNMLALEYGDDIVVIDAGIMFPEEDMPGVDLVLPDITYLLERRDKVRAILITHGHEDHTGAVPFVLRQLQVPVYAPKLAHGLIEVKLRDHRGLRDTELHQATPGQPLQFGAFEVTFFRVCHSIPDAMGLAIRTPLGIVVHTGDFKIDHTPVDGLPTDFSHLNELASDGVLLLLSDSTYAEHAGYTPSETVVTGALDRIIGDAPGRVIVATFASLISRVQQVIDAADRHNRLVAVMGAAWWRTSRWPNAWATSRRRKASCITGTRSAASHPRRSSSSPRGRRESQRRDWCASRTARTGHRGAGGRHHRHLCVAHPRQ